MLTTVKSMTAKKDQCWQYPNEWLLTTNVNPKLVTSKFRLKSQFFRCLTWNFWIWNLAAALFETFKVYFIDPSHPYLKLFDLKLCSRLIWNFFPKRFKFQNLTRFDIKQDLQLFETFWFETLRQNYLKLLQKSFKFQNFTRFDMKRDLQLFETFWFETLRQNYLKLLQKSFKFQNFTRFDMKRDVQFQLCIKPSGFLVAFNILFIPLIKNIFYVRSILFAVTFCDAGCMTFILLRTTWSGNGWSRGQVKTTPYGLCMQVCDPWDDHSNLTMPRWINTLYLRVIHPGVS